MDTLAISIFIVYIVFPLIAYVLYKVFGEKITNKEFERMKKSWR